MQYDTGWDMSPYGRQETAPRAPVNPVASAAELLRPRRARRAGMVGWVLASLAVVGCALSSLTLIGQQTGAVGLVTGMVLAALPVVPVLGSFFWLDRYESEPRGLLLFSFAWGAGVATFVALVVNTASTVAIASAGGDVTATSVFVAPVVEETLKGLVVLVILVVRRHEFDGVVDGMVYAGLAAAGFAFVENVLYLGSTLATEGTAGLVTVFVLRCVVSPFAHPLFTSATGIGLGLAARTRSWALRVVYPLLGWAAAIVLHGLFNASALVGLNGFTTAYVLFQVPVFAAFVALAVAARARERRLIARNLSVYCTSGWLTHAEVGMLASLPMRRQARHWARASGGEQSLAAMRAFQELGTELAFLRERLIRGTADEGAPGRECAVLEAMGQSRVLFLHTAKAG